MRRISCLQKDWDCEEAYNASGNEVWMMADWKFMNALHHKDAAFD